MTGGALPSRAGNGPRGTLIIVSGPSGSGKTTLVRRLLERRPGYRLSVSATTRPRRSGEEDGRDYHFVAGDEFERMRVGGELLEWSEHFGNQYGTPHGPVDAALAAGEIMILEIDVNGARQVWEAVPEAYGIFVKPPSWEVLEARLRGRKTEPEERLRERLARAQMEMDCSERFDHVVINDDVECAAVEMETVIESEARLKHAR